MTLSCRSPVVHEVAADYLTPAFFHDPYPTFARLRECGGLVWSPAEDAWLVARYHDAEEVLRDTSLSVRTKRVHNSPIGAAMVYQDPPEHTRLRGLIADLFTPAAVRSLEPHVAMHADRLLDAAVGRRRMDFVTDFALPFPVAVISELMGVPADSFGMMSEWSRALFFSGDAERVLAARRAMSEYLLAVIADPRSLRAGSMLEALAEAHRRRVLSAEALLDMCYSIYFAGHETMTSLLGNGLFTLLSHPGQYARLVANPDLLPVAIEEMVRFESPLQRGLVRSATRPMTLGGRSIDAGDEFIVLIGAANRDPRVFPEAETFRIDRDPNPHIAFGGGPHFCLGARLARTEARIGFERFLSRCALVRPAGTAAPTTLERLRRRFTGRKPSETLSAAWRFRPMFRSLESLAIEW